MSLIRQAKTYTRYARTETRADGGAKTYVYTTSGTVRMTVVRQSPHMIATAMLAEDAPTYTGVLFAGTVLPGDRFMLPDTGGYYEAKDVTPGRRVSCALWKREGAADG